MPTPLLIPATSIRPKARATAFIVIAVLSAACADGPTAAAENQIGSSASTQSFNIHAPVPILAEPLTSRHRFTDEVALQVRVKPAGRPTDVINLRDASNIAVVRFTVQPGVRFPWHSHPGLVMVSVTQGELVFVYANDCVQRRYAAGTAFIDPGFGNVHYAFNPTGGETVIVATFLGVPPAPAPLTNPVDPAVATALDAQCNVAAATGHAH